MNKREKLIFTVFISCLSLLFLVTGTASYKIGQINAAKKYNEITTTYKNINSDLQDKLLDDLLLEDLLYKTCLDRNEWMRRAYAAYGQKIPQKSFPRCGLD